MKTEPDWASPEFDYLQPWIQRDLDRADELIGGRAWAEMQARRAREARPHLIAELRRHLRDPTWDPRGATVTTLVPKGKSNG